MGFITNQWLKGSAGRNRGHYPVKAGLKLHPTTSNWCKRNGVLHKSVLRVPTATTKRFP